MAKIPGFFAYPSNPPEIGATIEAALKIRRDQHNRQGIESWRENDIAGRCIADPILEKIADSNILVADITRLNFNVTYEIGYALAKRKRVFLTRNSTIKSDDELTKDVGIFDTLGYKEYPSSRELAGLLFDVQNLVPIAFEADSPNKKSPVYIVLPRQKDDSTVRILSRVKKARLKFRFFDPEEQGRLSFREALDGVASSLGVIIPLLATHHVESHVHNLRAAFTAGIAHGLDRQTLLLQAGSDPVPLDYRDKVSFFASTNLGNIDRYIADFAPEITALLQNESTPAKSGPRSALSQLNLGASTAENELFELGNYYIETEEFQRAYRGQIQVIAGRKGSGKTALFVALRNRLRSNKHNVVLDLKPEGFQLLKFKQIVLDQLEEGTKEHTVTAFWEYLLLLEVCHKILADDKSVVMRDHTLYDQYHTLAKAYDQDTFVAEGDFSERMVQLTNRIADDFLNELGIGNANKQLKREQITNLLYKHDVPKLRGELMKYLSLKKGLWILFDNLDKGWPPHGIKGEDILLLRCLLDALGKLERYFNKAELFCRGMVFVRNDVLEVLLDNTPDRGKAAKAIIDWTDPDLLRELIKRRLVYSGMNNSQSFDQLWAKICTSHVDGEESSQYLIDRCLMRPRALIDLIQHCKSHAVNLGHEVIGVDDIKSGVEAFSADLVANIGFEIRDVFPAAEDILYSFIESGVNIGFPKLCEMLNRVGVDSREAIPVIKTLLWYGVLGVLRDNEDPTYIYNLKYDLKRMIAMIENRSWEQSVFHVNPAFWAGLEIATE